MRRAEGGGATVDHRYAVSLPASPPAQRRFVSQAFFHVLLCVGARALDAQSLWMRKRTGPHPYFQHVLSLYFFYFPPAVMPDTLIPLFNDLNFVESSRERRKQQPRQRLWYRLKFYDGRRGTRH